VERKVGELLTVMSKSTNNLLVSVVIPTKNEEKNIRNVLESIKRQTHKNIEIIVVDNYSIDRTKEIAHSYTNLVYNKGSERSAQRNFGIKIARGEYILILDADMILTERIIENCVNQFLQDETIGGIIIPEISIGEGFWVKCKALERSFYTNTGYMEAARFYKKVVLEELGGFDLNLISGEDWDLSQRVANKWKVTHISSYVYHNEGKLSLIKTMRKKFYYAKTISKYLEKSCNLENAKKQINILKRFSLFFSHPKKLFKHPTVGFCMIFMKLCEFCIGGLGYFISKKTN